MQESNESAPPVLANHWQFDDPGQEVPNGQVMARRLRLVRGRRSRDVKLDGASSFTEAVPSLNVVGRARPTASGHQESLDEREALGGEER